MPVYVLILVLGFSAILGLALPSFLQGYRTGSDARIGLETSRHIQIALIRMAGQARDYDQDGTVEADIAAGPASPPVDGWGRSWRVCAWNHGARHGDTAGLLPGLASGYGEARGIQIISAGEDGVFDTECGQAASGDDQEGSLSQREMAERAPRFQRGDHLARLADAGATVPGFGIGADPAPGFRLDVAGAALTTGTLRAETLLSADGSVLQARSATAPLFQPLEMAEASGPLELSDASARYLRIGWSDAACGPAHDGLLRYGEFGSYGIIEVCIGALASWRELARIES